MESKRFSLAKLPGQTQDPSAKIAREEMRILSADDHINAIEVERSAEEMDVESYATASYVIEQFWQFLREGDLKEFDSIVVKELEGKTRGITEVTAALRPAIKEYQRKFVNEVGKRVRSNEPLSVEDALAIRFMDNSRKRHHREQSGFPSMLDLPAFYARLLAVTEEVYERDTGARPTREQVFAAVDTPQSKRLIMELMTNSRDMANVVLGILENKGKPYADLDDPTGRFDPERFSLQPSSKGDMVIGIKPEVRSRLVSVLTKIALDKSDQEREPKRALQCPVLYTGALSGMFDWTSEQFRKYYT